MGMENIPDREEKGEDMEGIFGKSSLFWPFANPLCVTRVSKFAPVKCTLLFAL